MTGESIFNEALELPAAERSAFLDARCSGQPGLRAVVDRLLASHEGTSEIIEQPVYAVSGLLTLDTADAATLKGAGGGNSAPGDVIGGRYVLSEKIGEGGMGEVSVAKQTEPIKRKVALKLIRPGMNSKAMLARFEQERQALALMDHPNIARVIDGGLTPSGRPFFVMELVHGLPLTRYCDEARLTPRQRLEVFSSICRAIQHAHQKGIVHRDLKPANILVTLIDGKPVPKVIDFGVAKATSGKLTDVSLDTQFGSVIGTLEYMAPEQAGFSGEDIDTRADIYSLGVILYELLTGLKPMDAQRIKNAALLELFRVIKEEEPSKPSTRLSGEKTMQSLAALRQTDPQVLMAMLRGELDWVVMKCLEKSRERRYDSAGSLHQDIQRYLDNQPVDARPVSAAYRLQKFLQRNKGTAVAASVILLTLIAATIVSTWQAFRATAAEKEEGIDRAAAETARTHEETQRKKAEDEKKRADNARQLAESSQRQAEEQAKIADKERQIAEKARKVAENEHRRATAQLSRAEGLLYASKLKEAQNDFEVGDGSLAMGFLEETQEARRGWEYRYLKNRFSPLQSVAAHLWGLECLATSPDGTRVIAGGKSGGVTIWNTATWKELRTVPAVPDGEVLTVAFSPDGKQFVAGGGHRNGSKQAGEIAIFDAATGKLIRAFTKPKFPVWSAAWSPDGKRIVTGGGDFGYNPGESFIWDVASGNQLIELKGHTRGVRGVAFSPDGTRAVTGSDVLANVWDAATGDKLLELQPQSDTLRAVAYSPDGRTIITGAGSWGGKIGDVRAWDAGSGKQIGHMTGHICPVLCVAFSPDGARVASGSADKIIRVWDARTWQLLFTLKGHTHSVRGVAFSADSKRIFSADDSANGTLNVWDGVHGQELTRLGVTGGTAGLAFSPDSRHVAVAGYEGYTRIWDVETVRNETSFVMPSAAKSGIDGFTSVAYSGDGTRVVTGARENAARVWDVGTGKEVLTLPHNGIVLCVAYNADSTRILTGSVDKTACLWDAATGAQIFELKHPNGVLSVKFIPNSNAVVTSTHDHATIWSAETGQALQTLGGHEGAVWGVACSSDGRWIATGAYDKTVKLWDAQTGKLLRTLKGHTGGVRALAFSPKNERLVSAGDDYNAKIWDPETGYELLTLRAAHTNMLWSVAFSRDGLRIVTGTFGENSTTVVYFAPAGDGGE